MTRQPLGHATCFRRRAGVIERGRGGGEVVQAHTHALGRWVGLLDPPGPLARAVGPRPRCRDRHLSPASLRPTAEAAGARPVPLVCSLVACRRPRARRPPHAWRREPGGGRLVEGDGRPWGSRRRFLKSEPRRPRHHARGAPLRPTPPGVRPRRERGFCRTLHPVSQARASTPPHATTWSASDASVQRACPAGAGLQATASRGAPW
jgi:hypothetical protein